MPKRKTDRPILDMCLLSKVEPASLLNIPPNKIMPRNNPENSIDNIFEVKAKPNVMALKIQYLIFKCPVLKA